MASRWMNARAVSAAPPSCGLREASDKKETTKLNYWLCGNYGRWLIGMGLSLFVATMSQAQDNQQQKPPTTLGLEQGTMAITTPDFALKLVKTSQTVAALVPKGGQGFDFTPADRLQGRAGDGYFHIGDLTLRTRTGTAGPWKDYSTAADRHPVTALTASGATLAAADLSPTLPPDFPLAITRTWALEGGRLALRFTLTNKTTNAVQIGALGIPMVFNNIISNRTLEEAHAVCSFSDPYIGQDAGYLQVTRLTGQGPALLVVPEDKTPFEAYRLLREPTAPSQTFEGMFAWMVHSQAYAENEWKGASQWNPPTMATLTPGESRTYGVRFLVSDTIRHIDSTLAANNRPLALGIPGYVLPQDQDGRLFLKYAHKVRTVAVEPPDAITVGPAKLAKNGWMAYTLHGKGWGRARLTVTYDDGVTQSISYYVIKPEAQTVSDLGHFLTTKQWFDDPNDPFHRAPSVISYDREADKQVTQESRVWIAGLGDEGGSGSFVAAAMKEFGQPDPREVAKYEQFVDDVLWGRIQSKDGPNKYGVRKSVFFHDPAANAELPLRQEHRLALMDKLEQTVLGGYRARLQLSARRRGLLGDVPRRPQSSGAGHRPSLAMVSGSGVSDDQVYVQPGCRRQPPGRVCRTGADGGRCLSRAAARPEA